MQDQPTRPHAADDLELDQVEWVVLDMLLADHSPVLWSVRELGVALGSELAAQDAVVALHAAGLVHRFGEFVFPTRPAARFSELADAWQ